MSRREGGTPAPLSNSPFVEGDALVDLVAVATGHVVTDVRHGEAAERHQCRPVLQPWQPGESGAMTTHGTRSRPFPWGEEAAFGHKGGEF